MSNRFGKSHVDSSSVWVYKVYVPNYRTYAYGQDKPDILLWWTQDNAREIVEALENDHEHMGSDQRDKHFNADRTAITVYEDDEIKPTCEDIVTHELLLRNDWGKGSWQEMLVDLKTWIER